MSSVKFVLQMLESCDNRTGRQADTPNSGPRAAANDCELPMGKACCSEKETAHHRRERILPHASTPFVAGGQIVDNSL